MGIKQEAIDKLDKEYKSGKYDRYAEVMKKAVRDALADFAGQDTEFAQAIVQGGSFEDCMKAVAKGCGKSISDIEAYSRAVQFYFPGAVIRMQMKIDLLGDLTPEEPDDPNAEEKNALLIDISAFL